MTGQGQALQPEQTGRKGPYLALPNFGSSKRCFLTAQPMLWQRSLTGPTMVTEDWILLQALFPILSIPGERTGPMASGWEVEG